MSATRIENVKSRFFVSILSKLSFFRHKINVNEDDSFRVSNRNRNLKISKALLKSQAHQGTSLFTSAACFVSALA